MEGEIDTAHATPLNQNPASGPLVQVTFQKDPNRKTKYLESEPKALGCAQILLAVFLINVGILDDPSWISITEIINGIFPILAGSVAIAAQNLSLPRLKACLGLQVVTTITCSLTFLITTIEHVDLLRHRECRFRTFQNDSKFNEACSMSWYAEKHYNAEGKLVLVTVLAISVTLAVYCCKVIQCCSPASLTPVIIVNAPPASANRDDGEGESPSSE